MFYFLPQNTWLKESRPEQQQDLRNRSFSNRVSPIYSGLALLCTLLWPRREVWHTQCQHTCTYVWSEKVVHDVATLSSCIIAMLEDHPGNRSPRILSFLPCEKEPLGWQGGIVASTLHTDLTCADKCI